MGHRRLCGSNEHLPHKPLAPSLALLAPPAGFFRIPLLESLSDSTELAPGSLPAPGTQFGHSTHLLSDKLSILVADPTLHLTVTHDFCIHRDEAMRLL